MSVENLKVYGSLLLVAVLSYGCVAINSPWRWTLLLSGIIFVIYITSKVKKGRYGVVTVFAFLCLVSPILELYAR